MSTESALKSKIELPVVSSYEEVAKYLIFLSKQDTTSAVSQTKIQKLAYYCYSWFLVMTENKERLFEERPQAWVFGPVIEPLYDNWDVISLSVDDNYATSIEVSLRNFIELVHAKYDVLDKYELVELTHQERPWISARDGLNVFEASHSELSDEEIYAFYSQNA